MSDLTHNSQFAIRNPNKIDNPTVKTVDEYIARFPADVQAILQLVRQTINDAAPEAKEVISYQMPAFQQMGSLVYYAAWKNHIGFYPPVSDDNAELLKDKRSMRDPRAICNSHSIRPMPLELIRRIVKQRIKENLERAARKNSKDEKRK